MDEREDVAGSGSGGAVAPFVRPASAEPLDFAVELWTAAGDAPEQVIGRAAGAAVARAIFTAAQAEHPGRRLTLRRGGKVIAEVG